MGHGLSGAIIAAGRGERLRQAVDGIPKPLVEIGGETLLMRQARAMLSMGAAPVHVIVNTETARIVGERGIKLPAGVELCVRDTANSMESLLALGERIAPGRFILATVDAIIAQAEFQRFIDGALVLTGPACAQSFDGALGVVKWRGDKRPLFAEVAASGEAAASGLITALGGDESALVTAGVYFFSTRIFDYSAKARSLGLDALRKFLGLLVDNGMKFAAIELSGVIDVDEAEDLAAARAMVPDSKP